MSLAGRLLVASPLLGDPNFHRTVILVLTHDESGAVGVILNRPSTSSVAEHLPDWSGNAVDPPVVFIGGPVEPAVAICLERANDEAEPIPGIGLIDLTNMPGDEQVRVFSGYAGWGGGQLEDELAEGAWIVAEPVVDDAFSANIESLWGRVLRRQGGPAAMLATFPTDPGLN
ncbi:MAG: YqgE/AlgH family protein [Acidimicrobiia bacterium]|nr:YqgE/AlgH family protein [Acidimicrobiia bacterium]